MSKQFCLFVCLFVCLLFIVCLFVERIAWVDWELLKSCLILSSRVRSGIGIISEIVSVVVVVVVVVVYLYVL